MKIKNPKGRKKIRWSYEMESFMVEFYKKNPALWNYHSAEYTSRIVQNRLYSLLEVQLKDRYPIFRQWFSRVRIKAKFYSMQKYYRLVKMRATICGNSTFEWKHFSDFAYFDAVLEHPNGSEGSTSAGQAGVFTDDMDEEADEQIVIEHPSSHELLCVNDMDTKESIVISSDEDLDISGANIKRESAMSQRRRAQSMFRDFPDRSDTPATTSQSGVMNGTSRDDGIRLEDQKFCDFLASRMKDMTKEQARDIQMKILMLLNKEC